jgi:hypothetical protein
LLGANKLAIDEFCLTRDTLARQRSRHCFPASPLMRLKRPWKPAIVSVITPARPRQRVAILAVASPARP